MVLLLASVNMNINVMVLLLARWLANHSDFGVQGSLSAGF